MEKISEVKGLTTAEAQKRLLTFGRNDIVKEENRMLRKKIILSV